MAKTLISRPTLLSPSKTTRGLYITESISGTALLQGQHQFVFTPRANSALTYATPYFMSTTALTPTALDLVPNQNTNQATARSTGNGFAWFDVCDANPEASPSGTNVMRVAIDDNTGLGSYIASRNYSSGQGSRPFTIRVPINTTGGDAAALKFLQALGGVANADAYASWTVDPVVQVAPHGGSVVLGSAYKLAVATTVGHVHMPLMSGAPTGTPPIANAGKYGTGWTSGNAYSTMGAGHTAPMVVDDTNNKIWVYIGGAWKGVVVS